MIAKFSSRMTLHLVHRDFLGAGSTMPISDVNVYEHSSEPIVMPSRTPHARKYSDLACLLLIAEFLKAQMVRDTTHDRYIPGTLDF